MRSSDEIVKEIIKECFMKKGTIEDKAWAKGALKEFKKQKRLKRYGGSSESSGGGWSSTSGSGSDSEGGGGGFFKRIGRGIGRGLGPMFYKKKRVPVYTSDDDTGMIQRLHTAYGLILETIARNRTDNPAVLKGKIYKELQEQIRMSVGDQYGEIERVLHENFFNYN